MPTLTDQDAFAAEPTLAVVAEHVSKIYCEDFDRTRLNIARALLRGGRRRSALEPGEYFAVRDVSFLVPRGSTLVVFGTRSSGKSTLARMLCGVLHADRGALRVDGRPQYIAGGRLGGNIFMKAGEYVDLAATLAGVPAGRMTEVREDVLEFCGLAGQASRSLGDLPRIITRMMSLCASLHTDADVLVFDDVLGGQSARAARWLARVERSLETRTGVVFTGSANAVPASADHALVLHDGRVLFYGSPSQAAATFRELQDEIAGKATIAPMTPARRKFLSRFPAELPLLSRVGVAPRFAHSASALAELDSADSAADDAEDQPSASPLRRRLTLENDAWAPAVLADEIARLARGRRPIVAGPWFGDPGSELVYWVPFLTWAAEQGGIGRDRLVAVTDGGAAAWYQHAAARVYELGDLLDAGALDEHTRHRATLPKTYKQRFPTWPEQQVLDAAAARAGLSDYDALHPLYMHRMVWLALWRWIPPAAAMHLCVHRAIDPPAQEGLDWLPSRFVAVRFEDSQFLPDSEESRAFISAQVRALAAHVPVVMLEGAPGPFQLDGVADVLWLTDRDTCGRRRAACETAIIGRAAALVGNFSGLSFVAPCVGTPALAFHGGSTGSRLRHIEAAKIGFRKSTYDVVDVADVRTADAPGSYSWNWVRRQRGSSRRDR